MAPTNLPPDPRARTMSQYEREHLLALLEEKADRRLESLKLYEPNPFQQRLHECKAKERLAQAGNQVGKSLGAAIEFARAVTGQDPYDKYPKEDGVGVCVGFKEEHIGLNIYPYLFQAGKFKIIRDKDSGAWRTFKPWLPDDKAREKEARPAPPLIPQRFIKGGPKGFSWKKKNKKIFYRVELVNGWVIYAFTSLGEPVRGFQADLVWIDEDLERAEWYDEMIARLIMRSGKLLWSSLPYNKNDALVRLVERAEMEQNDPEPSTVCIRATIYDNPYMSDKEREEFVKRCKSQGEDVYRMRVLGEMVRDSYLMYPTFSLETHGALGNPYTPPNPVQEILKQTNGEPPQDWCLYAVVDPGHTVCAVVFFATPPPSLGDYRVAYDMLYLRRCDAEMFGNEFEKKAQGRTFQAFIIDAHGGALSDFSTGQGATQHYSKQLSKRGIRSVQTRSTFLPGCDNIPHREEALRDWLTVRPNGYPTLLVNIDRCSFLVEEFKRFRKKIGSHGYALDEGQRRGFSHAIECVEYAAASQLPYVRPPSPVVEEPWAVRLMKDLALNARRRLARTAGPHGSATISLGPNGASSG